MPRRVHIETEDDVGPVRGLSEVASVSPLAANSDSRKHGAARWELELHENADPQAVLQFCFEQRIRLHSFNQFDPTLHEVFMRLVGPEAKEAVFR